MTTKPNRLLDALTATIRETSFTCPRTELQLTIRLPTRAICAEARMVATTAWGGRDIRTELDLEEYQSYQREQLLARCVFVAEDQDPIGIDTVQSLDEATLRRYDAELREIEEAADPPLESWTQEAVDNLIADIKKKDAGIAVRLKTFGETRLIGLVLCMGALLVNCETSNSSTSTSGSAKDSKPSPL